MTNANDAKVDFERLLHEGALLAADCARDGWRRDLQQLVGRAEALAARNPDRPAGHYVAGRLAWLDVDGELAEPRALPLLRRAAAADPGYLPAVALARHVADFLGAFDPPGPLLDEAVRWAGVLVDRAGGHPGAVALRRAERAFRRSCTGGGDCLPWPPDERQLYERLETEILSRPWDGISVAALPLW